MNTVYLVTKGQYSDYSVCAAFTSKELAEKFIVSFQNSKWDDEMCVEEYPLDPYEPQLRAGFQPYFVRMTKDGKASDVRISESPYGFAGDGGWDSFDIHNNMTVHVFASSEQHAIKICNEKRAQLIAMNKWPEKK